MTVLVYVNIHGLVTPCGIRDQAQHWIRQWLAAWWHQAISWSNVNCIPRKFSVKIRYFLLTKIHFKMLSAQWQQYCSSFNMLMVLVNTVCKYSCKCYAINCFMSEQYSAILTTEFQAWLEHGTRKFNLKPCWCMFTWAKMGSLFEVIILVVHSKVPSYHLTSTKFPITTEFIRIIERHTAHIIDSWSNPKMGHTSNLMMLIR